MAENPSGAYPSGQPQPWPSFLKIQAYDVMSMLPKAYSDVSWASNS